MSIIVRLDGRYVLLPGGGYVAAGSPQSPVAADASAIAFTPSGPITADDVQAAILEAAAGPGIPPGTYADLVDGTVPLDQLPSGLGGATFPRPPLGLYATAIDTEFSPTENLNVRTVQSAIAKMDDETLGLVINEGDLLVGLRDGRLVRIPGPTEDGQVLTADLSIEGHVRWGLPPVPPPTAPSTPGLFGVYEADAITGLIDGASLGLWPDTSGVGNDLVPHNTPAWDPTYKTAIFGDLPGVRFSGTFQSMECDYASAISVPTTFFVVWRYQGSLSANPAFMDGGTVNERNVQGLASGANMRITNGASILAGPGSVFDNDLHQWTFVVDGSSSSIRLDGTEIATGNAGTGSMTGLILADFANWGGSSQVDIAAVRCSSAALTIDEIEAEETYLRTKWGTP